MTLGDMITKALRKANVIRENTIATAEMNRDAIDTFNGLMSRLDADNVDIGDYPVTVVGDVLDIEREHVEPIKLMFAILLQVDHGLPLEPGLVARATAAEKFLLRNTAQRPAVSLSHAPLGRAKSSGYNINNG